MQYTIASILALASSAAATYASTAAPVIHQVSVSNSNGDLSFTPNDFTANKGDFVEFTFNPKNHSVVQSNFAMPCIPIEESVPAHGPGFFSGYMPVTAGETPAKTFTIEVTDVSKPIWFYCSQGRHCQSGMVGVINATPQQTLAGFKALAANVTTNTPAKQIFGGVDITDLTNTTWNTTTTTTTTLENTWTSTVDTLTTLETAWTVSDSTVTTTITAPLAGYTSATTGTTGTTGETGNTGNTGSTGETGNTGNTGSDGTDTGSSTTSGSASTTSSTTTGSDLTSGIAQSNSASSLVGSPLSLLGLVAAGVFFLA